MQTLPASPPMTVQILILGRLEGAGFRPGTAEGIQSLGTEGSKGPKASGSRHPLGQRQATHLRPHAVKHTESVQQQSL